MTKSPEIPEDELRETFIRASGPGGQNVNKLSTAVELRFDVRASPTLSERVRERLIELSGNRMTLDGVLIIKAERFRTQDRNRQDARERLQALVAEAAKPPPPVRRATKPSRGAKERRLSGKAVRAGIKKMRGRPGED